MCFIAVSLDFLIHHRPRDFLVVLLSCLSFLSMSLSSNIMKSFQTQINMSICLWIRFRSKYEPIIHNNSSSCCLSHQNPHTYLFRAASLVNCAWSVQISDQMTFSLDKTILLIDDLYFSNGLKLKTDLFRANTQLSLRMLTDGLEWCGLLWCVYQLFGLIPTAPIHCRGYINEQVMQCYISPNLKKKQTHLHLGWPEDHIFICVWTVPLTLHASAHASESLSCNRFCSARVALEGTFLAVSG